MRKDILKVDNEEYVSLDRLKRLCRKREFRPTAEAPDDERRPLAFGVRMFYEMHTAVEPTFVVDVGQAVRKRIEELTDIGAENGYDGWPSIKATRDALVRLVAEMDKWDQTSPRTSDSA